MIRTALLLNIGVAAVLCGLFVALMWAVPARAAGLHCAPGLVAASWYGKETCRYNPDPRCPTAGGVLHYDGSQLLAAHRTLPMHTRVRVTFKSRSIVIPILDRGPAKRTGKSIDLSKAAAQHIGLAGIGCVKMEVLK